MNIVKYINKIMYRVNSNIIRTMNSYNIIYNIKNFLPIYTLIIGIVGIVIIHFYFLKKEVIMKQEIKENNRSGENERLKIKEKELKMIYIKKYISIIAFILIIDLIIFVFGIRMDKILINFVPFLEKGK